MRIPKIKYKKKKKKLENTKNFLWFLFIDY